LPALGIDYDDVVQTLEDDGVAKFDVSLRTCEARKPLPAGGGIVGEVALPAGDGPSRSATPRTSPNVVVAALTQDGHAGQRMR
jgi:hypothetical protein